MVEVGVPTQTGGCIIETNAEAIDMVGSGDAGKDWSITVEFRIMVMVAVAAGTDAVMGVHAGSKGIHPTPSTPKTDRDRSAVIRPTAMVISHNPIFTGMKFNFNSI